MENGKKEPLSASARVRIEPEYNYTLTIINACLMPSLQYLQCSDIIFRLKKLEPIKYIVIILIKKLFFLSE